jgi:predicted small secreted protein
MARFAAVARPAGNALSPLSVLLSNFSGLPQDFSAHPHIVFAVTKPGDARYRRKRVVTRNHLKSSWLRRAARVTFLVAGGSFSLAACQGMGPAMTNAVVGFGQDVLAAASQNFAPQYASAMQNLFLAMAETATGMPFTQPTAHAGYGAQGSYGDDGDGQQSYDPGAYEYEAYGQAGNSHGSGWQEDHSGTYQQEVSADAGQYAGQPLEPPQQQAYHPSQQQAYHPPQQQAYYPPQQQAHQLQPAYAPLPGVGLEVALLAQQRLPDGQVRLRPVNDGDVLRDGRGDPARGDKIKVLFTANCACYVYVIGVDATGYVAQIYPQGDIRAPAPVAAHQQHLVPEGSIWWGLDDTRGVEHIYFIASRERRRDIEDLVAQMAGQRPSLPAGYRAVREPAIVPVNRGLVQVQSASPTAVPTDFGAPQQISPTMFQSTVRDADLVITRWFRHE